MDLTLTPVPDLRATSLRLAVSGSAVGLYTGELVPNSAGSFDFTLQARALQGPSAVAPARLVLPQLLSVPPSWDLQFSAEAAGTVGLTPFGGAWSTLAVDTFSGELTSPSWRYVVEQTERCRFLKNSAAGTPARTLLSAVFSGCRLGIIGLESQEGQLVPGVSVIVGSPEEPVQDGVVFGDLSKGLPDELGVIWLESVRAGAVSPDGTLPGVLRLAPYDHASDTLGTPVSLFEGVQISELDAAVLDTAACVVASTGSGALLVGLVGTDGSSLGTANLPVGPWSNVGCWITSPSVVPTPGKTPGFTLAFAVMEDLEPVAVYVGTLAPPQQSSSGS